jgi:hypothetical protein
LPERVDEVALEAPIDFCRLSQQAVCLAPSTSSGQAR